MNVKQWVALLILYVGYLLLGALLFYYLERDHETIKRNEDFRIYKDLAEVLKKAGINRTTALLLESYCGRPLTENADMDDVSHEYWSFYKSIVFVLTVVSTVGYGNIHPTMPLTRYLMILYAVIGLPINAILLTSLASFFSTVFIRAHKKYKRYESRFGLTVDVLTYLIPGILVFIFLPATAFYYFEEWTFEESVYYAFVTLTTIGFGDYVAGQKNYKGFSEEAAILYKTLLLGWIIFGLGYLIMLLGYLTRAMRSKKVVKLEQKLIEALTRSKIWSGFTKDLGYLRRIMNELYLDKFKPVFRDDHLPFHRKHTCRRSKSLPNIMLEAEKFGSDDEKVARKRTHSEYVASREGLTRVFSDSDLHRIDKNATFASATAIRPSELFQQVVGAVEDSMMWKQEESVGIDVFSDDEILQSEGWNNETNLYHPSSYEDIASGKRKEKPLSDFPGPRSVPHTITSNSNFKRWNLSRSGSNVSHIFNAINEQHRNNLLRKNSKNRNLSRSPSFLTGSRWLFNPLRKKKLHCDSPDIAGSKLSIFHNSDLRFLENLKFLESEPRKWSLCDGGSSKYKLDISYMTHTAGTGTKGLGLVRRKTNSTKGEYVCRQDNRRFLDETTLGDFLRALTVLHNRVAPRQNNSEVPHQDPATDIPGSIQSHSLIDLSPAREAPSIFSIPELSLNRTESMPTAIEKEPSNLKRLGRFLLRSYPSKSEAPLYSADKSDEYAFEPEDKSDFPDDHRPPSSVQIQIQSSVNEKSPCKRDGISRSNTMDSGVRLKRRQSAGVLGIPFRPASSTESVYHSLGRKEPHLPRPMSSKWRTSAKGQPDTFSSSKPTLSNVKEDNN